MPTTFTTSIILHLTYYLYFRKYFYYLEVTNLNNLTLHFKFHLSLSTNHYY